MNVRFDRLIFLCLSYLMTCTYLPLKAETAQEPTDFSDTALSQSLSESLTDAALSEALNATNRRPYQLSTSHAIEGGKGRESYQGYRLQDSASATLNQFFGDKKLSETFDLSAGTRLQTKKLAEGDMGLTLRYKFNGFSLSGNTGLNYSPYIYNSLTQQEIRLDSAAWNYIVGAGLSQNNTLESDSTWNWTWGLYYAGFNGVIHTFELALSAEKEWKNFTFTGGISATRQKQDSIAGTCSSADSCIGGTPKGTSNDIGLSGGMEWSSDHHLIGLNTSLDWLFEPTTTGLKGKKFRSPVQKTWAISLTYVYSPISWMDVGAYFEPGVIILNSNKSGYWTGGVYFSLMY